MASPDDDVVIEDLPLAPLAGANWARAAAGEVAGDVVAELAAPLADLRDRLALIVDRIDRHVAEAPGPVPYPWKSLQAMRQDLAALYLSTTTMADLGGELAGIVRGLGGPPVTVEVERAVEGAVSLTRHRIGARTELLVDIGSVPHVTAPAAELTLIVARMIGVCVRSADAADRASLSVRTRAEADWVVIMVADNGAGAPAEVAALAQAAAVFASAYGGGFVGASEVGQGSALELRLPPVPA